jgi:phosphoribosylformylglycinamidine cyclo-ligase
LPGNVNRALPATLDARIDTTRWTIPNEYLVLQDAGHVSREEMFRAFNRGVGMVLIAQESAVDVIVESARTTGVAAWVIGRTVSGTGRVILDQE